MFSSQGKKLLIFFDILFLLYLFGNNFLTFENIALEFYLTGSLSLGCFLAFATTRVTRPPAFPC